AAAHEIVSLVLVDVGADAAVHPELVLETHVGPLTLRRIVGRKEDVYAASRRVGIVLRRAARVVVGDDVVATVAVEIDDGDLVTGGDLVVDHTPGPRRAAAGVNDHFIAVPWLNRREEALAVLHADADVAGAQTRRLFLVTLRQ